MQMDNGFFSLESMGLDKYKGPVELLILDTVQQAVEQAAREFDAQAEMVVMGAIRKLGVLVDKEELIRALRYDRDQYAIGFRDGVAIVRTDWTDVREELPKKPNKYIVQSKTGAIYTARYDPDIYKRWPHFGKADAAYWMPLPKRKEVEG